MNIKSNERVAVVGMTGSGKTVLVKKFCQQYNRAVFIDFKKENSDLENTLITSNYEEAIKHIDSNSNFFIVLQPLDLNEETFDQFCEEIFNRNNLTLIFDEIYFICFPKVCEFHGKLIRMGRSKGIGLVHCTQRPNYVDQALLSESNHFFIFRLQLEGDRKKVEGIIGQDLTEPMKELNEYEFLYYNYKEGFKIFEPVDF